MQPLWQIQRPIYCASLLVCTMTTKSSLDCNNKNTHININITSQLSINRCYITCAFLEATLDSFIHMHDIKHNQNKSCKQKKCKHQNQSKNITLIISFYFNLKTQCFWNKMAKDTARGDATAKDILLKHITTANKLHRNSGAFPVCILFCQRM